MISYFFRSGHVVDFILLVMVAEFMFMSQRGRRWRAGAQGTVDLMLALAPGACLLLALRAALTGASLIWVGGMLAISLPIHIADLQRRGSENTRP